MKYVEEVYSFHQFLPSICLSILPFILPSVIPSIITSYNQVLLLSFFDYLYLCSHWSKTFHIWYGDTWEGSLPFYIYEPLGHARGQNLGSLNKVVYCNLYKQLLNKERWASDMFITTFTIIRSRWLWPCFHAPAILPYILKTISWICDTLNIGSMWHHNWQHNKCRSPVILPYILNVIWCMNIIIWDYDSVWSGRWP